MNFKYLTLPILLLVMGVYPMQAAIGIGEEPLTEVLNKIGEEYKAVFSYNIKDLEKIAVEFEFKKEEELTVVVNRVLKNTGLKYKSLGGSFYVIHKDTKAGRRKLKKIERKIQQIGKLGTTSDLRIANKSYSIAPMMNMAADLTKPQVVRGRVTNEEGQGLIGATIMATGTDAGTATDLDGFYELEVPVNSEVLAYTYTGYSNAQMSIQGQSLINVQLREGIALQSVTVFGSRGKPRTSFDSPVPVDHISIDVLETSGKNSLDQQLMLKAPSFNATQQPVSDATAHFNPADLRGLLPSRTLVLINGKRKNSSALVYSVTTVGRGEVGVDLQSVAPEAIERVEILRDGATAQYGSDAVAGVINLVLKKKIAPFTNIGYSTTSEGDGTQYNIATGFSVDITEKGYANFTLAYTNQRRSQRAGTIHSPEAEADYWGTDIYTLNDFEAFIARNPSAGGQVGLPDKSGFNFSFNAGYTLNAVNKTELYAFGTLMKRTGSSPQFARVPYWVTGFEAIYPNKDFFLPEMSPKIEDNTLAIGLRTTFKGWDIDISTTGGRNKIDYYITNSFNQSLGVNSPRDFYNGAHVFSHVVNNIDAVQTFKPSHLKALTLAFGAEQRTENFKTKAGEFASYGDGSPDIVDRIGSESFSGFKPENISSNNRSNLGVYTELNADFTKKLLIGGALRFEHYSDFGSNVSWKFASRYKAIKDQLNLRASVSNGFRAPALHQIYYTATTTTLTQEGVVQNRILNNLNPALQALEIPKLQAETSFNLGAGFTYRITEKLGFAVDIYHIQVADRIVLSGQVGKTGNADSPIDQLLNSIHTSSAGFFLNAVNTTTKGVDLVLNFEDTRIGKGNIKGSIAANFNRTSVTKVNLPNFIETNNLMNNILSREDISRIESWRPRQKIIATTTYSIGKWSPTLSLFYYGQVEYQHPSDADYDAIYSGKLLTDISAVYAFTDKIQVRMGANNIFNVYPDTFIEAYNGITPDTNLDFVGRFKYPWQTTQFGIDGRRYFIKLNFIF